MGVVKRRVLQGLWRRLVGVGIIGPGLIWAPVPIMPLAARFPAFFARPSPCPTRLQSVTGPVAAVVAQHRGMQLETVTVVTPIAPSCRGSFALYLCRMCADRS
jgi:hypothetical protein